MDRSDWNAGVEIRVAIHLWQFFSLVLTIVARYANKSLLEWKYIIQEEEGKTQVLQSTCYDNLYWELWHPVHIFLNRLVLKLGFIQMQIGAEEGNHERTAIHLLWQLVYLSQVSCVRFDSNAQGRRRKSQTDYNPPAMTTCIIYKLSSREDRSLSVCLFQACCLQVRFDSNAECRRRKSVRSTCDNPHSGLWTFTSANHRFVQLE